MVDKILDLSDPKYKQLFFFRTIYNDGGIRGLWQGASASIPRIRDLIILILLLISLKFNINSIIMLIGHQNKYFYMIEINNINLVLEVLLS